MIESTHESLDRWKNPALCSYAIRQIEQHYQKICLHDLSSALKIDPSYLSRVLSQNLHVTFLDLLHTKRIFVALEYFSNSKKIASTGISGHRSWILFCSLFLLCF